MVILKKIPSKDELGGQKSKDVGENPLMENEDGSEEKVDLELNEDDLLSSQELLELAKSVGLQGS